MWLKKAPINLFSLALLIAALYFTIFVTNVYAIGTFVFLMVCFLKQGIRPVFRRFILFEG